MDTKFVCQTVGVALMHELGRSKAHLAKQCTKKLINQAEEAHQVELIELAT
jgi:hypothetical protein